MNRIEEQIGANLAEVRERISRACARAGRLAESVQLVAVTKYAAWEWVEILVDLGVRRLGESRPQQLIERSERLPAEADVEWHLIGHLQRNKVRPILPRVARIHSVDSLRLLERIEWIAKEMGLSPKVLLEVNVSEESTKDGFSVPKLESRWEELLEFSQLEITGLMTMAPHTDDQEIVRSAFRKLRRLRDELETRSQGRLKLPELSMGMSGDFEPAIEEGATHIRVGSGLFTGLES